MKQLNKFVIGKKKNLFFKPGYYDENGQINSNSDGRKYADAISSETAKYIVIDRFVPDNDNYICYASCFDEDNKVTTVYIKKSGVLINIPDGTVKVAITISSDINISTGYNSIMALCYDVTPHYKNIKKKYAKESEQIFFRESLDGKITLFGDDYNLVNKSDLEDELVFDIYANNKLYSTNSFNKSDCKFNHFKHSVELKLTANDNYSKVLDAYENTYDLIKLAPALTRIQLTKRAYAQIYIQGSDVVSNYFGGTYWETEVSEVIDSEDDLTNKYYFAKGPIFQEISLSGFNYYNLNTVFRCLYNSLIWNASASVEVLGNKYRVDSSIVLKKVLSKGDYASEEQYNNTRLLSNDTKGGISTPSDIILYKADYDIYSIEIYSSRDGKGSKLYQSQYYYANDSELVLPQGEDKIKMIKVSQTSPNKEPEPAEFYLGDNVINYQIWGRLLCAIDKLPDGTPTYDLPYDDFATERANFKRCIGLLFTHTQESQSTVQIVQSQETSEQSTPYGQNDYEEYFVAPYSIEGKRYIPLARSTWANTSLWVYFKDDIQGPGTYEYWVKDKYVQFTLKDSYDLADAIKALLAKIDPSIKHEGTAEYSKWLYGDTSDSEGYNHRGGCRVYITQKSNILKGDYDQAAQKAEITFKQLMDMLKYCFKCYWYIDEQKRFIIEHITYFMNGLSYKSANVQFDLTKKFDRFNKKQVLYSQLETEFDKNELMARYEFAWMDDVTDSFGNLYIDVKSNYIQKDKTSDITIEQFTPDLDFMMLAPNEFSSDGFALIMAKDKVVPIVRSYLKDENQDRYYYINAQNWYASWNSLVEQYMYDMPAYTIEANMINDRLHVSGIKKCVTHDIQYQSTEDPSMYKLIGTELGNGEINEVSVDIDTRVIEATLLYTPK